MNLLDIIIIIPIIWFAYRGFSRGLIIELASLVGLILGIYAALYFSDYAAEIIERNFNLSSGYLSVISFIVTFIIVVIMIYIIGRMLEKLIDMVALGFLNKLAGLVFGVLKAVVLISLALLVINHYNDKLISSEKKENSLLYGPIAEVAPFLWQNIENFNFKELKNKKPANDTDNNVI